MIFVFKENKMLSKIVTLIVFTVGSAISSALPITYTQELNDIADLILERTRQIVKSHQLRNLSIPDLEITFKEGIGHPTGEIHAQNGQFYGLNTLRRDGDAFLIQTSDSDIKLVALMKMDTMNYDYRDYNIIINNTVQDGSMNVVIKENLIKMDLHISFDNDCTFELSDLNIKIANNYTVQLSVMELNEAYYKQLITWACENYLTVITDVVRKALYDNINQAIHDLDICNFIVSPNGLADLLPERQLNIPLISLKLDKFFL